MILVVDALNHDQCSDVLNEISALQARLLGADLDAQIDTLGTAYIAQLDKAGAVVAFAKFRHSAAPLLPIRPLSKAAKSPPRPFGPILGETVQFCVDVHRCETGAGANTRLQVTVELMIGVLEHAKNAGVVDIVTVTDPYMISILKQANCPAYDHLDTAAPMGARARLLALLECGEGRIAALRAYAGIGGDVFITAATARALRKARAMPPPDTAAPTRGHSEIAAYCAEQLAAAHTEDERAAAQRLVNHLVAKGMHPLPQ